MHEYRHEGAGAPTFPSYEIFCNTDHFSDSSNPVSVVVYMPGANVVTVGGQALTFVGGGLFVVQGACAGIILDNPSLVMLVRP